MQQGTVNRVDRFWSAIELNPSNWSEARDGYRDLLNNAANASREDLRRTMNWLEACLVQIERPSAAAACRYLTKMPEELLAAEYGRLLQIFNSKKVGMVWPMRPNYKEYLPRGPVPNFGAEAGFGLVRSNPELYVKLAKLGPEMEEVIIQLVGEAIRFNVSIPEDLMAFAPAPSATG